MAKEVNNENWNNRHLYKVSNQREPVTVENVESDKLDRLRTEIEPWLTALFQSEHLSLLLGSGIFTAVHFLANNEAGVGMDPIEFKAFKIQIDEAAKKSAKESGRGEPNIEDQIRVCNDLIRGLDIYVSCTVPETKNNNKHLANLKEELNKLKEELNEQLTEFANRVLQSENNIIQSDNSEQAAERLMSFLISFASRSATRERLNIFTTNYDRIIEYGSELAGIRLIDRFVGTINPVFRSSRVEVDMHYNPPGIRGEPRYLEGVVQFTKLHGSLDWSVQDGVVRRFALPLGAEELTTFLDEGAENLLIYPNAAKDMETAEYPYVELFRDFAASVCRANSTMVVYGYSFGDDHINRVIADMLTIPSTHLVIISFNDEGDRVKRFYDKVKRPAQISLLLGNHFGDLTTLTENYLPKPAIDRTTIKMAELLRSRGITALRDDNSGGDS